MSVSGPRDSVVVRVLRWLAGAICRHRRRFLYPHVVLFFLSLLVTFQRLEFDANRSSLVDANQPYHRNFLRFKAEFKAQEDLVALIESEDIEKNRQFVERLAARMEGETNLFTDVFYKGDLKLMGPKALLFVTNETILVEMHERLREARPVLETFSQVTNLNSLFREVNRQFRAAGRERSANTNASAEALIRSLPALTRVADLAADALRRPGTPPSPGVTAMFDGGAQAEQNLYLTFASNRVYLVTARPAEPRGVKKAVQRLRELVRQTQSEVPGVDVGITGEPVLEVDEMTQSQRDMTLATVVSLVLCAGLFALGYKETGRPLKAMLCLVVGLVYTLGFTSLTIGHLNILTVTFLPILVGLAIDFGIHLVTRYEEELRAGRTEAQALEKALVNTGLGIFTGCVTTAAAFLAMGFTEFRGIREMGIISGAGLLICLVPMMTLLPVLLLRGRQNVLDHAPPSRPDARARIERLWLDRPAWVATATLGLSVVSLTQVSRVEFDYNLLNLQSEGLPAVEYEHRLIDAASRSVIFGVIVTDSLPHAAALQAQVAALPSVARVDSMVTYLSENQTRKLALIQQIKAQLADVRFGEIDASPVNLAELRQTLQASYAYFGLGASGAAQEGEAALSEELRGVRRAIARLRQTMEATENPLAVQRLSSYQRALFEDLQGTLLAIREQDDQSPLQIEDIPAPLRNRFVSRSGELYLLQINPKSNVWERANQEVFVRELRAVDPAVTGPPVQLYEYTRQLKDSYVEAAWYALAAITVMVFVHFRRLGCVLLALLPVALGALWTLGYMGWQGLPFNPANIMTLPLVVGVGVTNGIHILNRFAEEQNPSILARSTGKAVLLSALTTIAGFGSLILAKHQGIASLGLLMAIGTSTCMIAGLTFLPSLLHWCCQRGWSPVPRQGGGGST